MQWTPEQLEELYAAAYDGRFECPTCGGPLRLMRSQEIGAIGSVECQSCGAKYFISQPGDPLRPKFRDYTPDENNDLVQAHQSGMTPNCPVDGTRMRVTESPTLGAGTQVIIQCLRCGYNAQYRRRP